MLSLYRKMMMPIIIITVVFIIMIMIIIVSVQSVDPPAEGDSITRYF